MDIKSRLLDIEQQLYELGEERLRLQEALRKLEIEEDQRRFADWNPSFNRYIILCSKDNSVIKTVMILDYDYDSLYVVEGTYIINYDSVPSYRIERLRLANNVLKGWEERYDVFFQDKDNFNKHHTTLCSLEVDVHTFKMFKDDCVTTSTHIISKEQVD